MDYSSNMRKPNMKGYDFDGVVSAGIKPQNGDIIITGRTVDRSGDIESMKKEMGCPDVPVCYFPSKQTLDRNPHMVDELVGRHKADHLRRMGIHDYYENNAEQKKIIEKYNPDVNVHLVGKVIKKYAVQNKKSNGKTQS